MELNTELKEEALVCSTCIVYNLNLLSLFFFTEKIEGSRRGSRTERYVLQVAGCGLKFNYNWKTAGTLVQHTSGGLTVTVT